MKTRKTTGKKKDEASNSGDEPIEMKGLEEMQLEELSGDSEKSDLNLSETDEDESEGLGDGNIGRTTPDLVDK